VGCASLSHFFSFNGPAPRRRPPGNPAFGEPRGVDTCWDPARRKRRSRDPRRSRPLVVVGGPPRDNVLRRVSVRTPQGDAAVAPSSLGSGHPRSFSGRANRSSTQSSTFLKTNLQNPAARAGRADHTRAALRLLGRAPRLGPSKGGGLSGAWPPLLFAKRPLTSI